MRQDDEPGVAWPTRGMARLRKTLGSVGPGVITGVADDDPVAIGTYAQAGATHGYALTWLPLLCFPLMAGVQEISARIGRTTGRGLASCIADHYPRPLLLGMVALLAFANVIAIAADLAAMADVTCTLLGGPAWIWVGGYALLCVTLQVFMSYARYVSVLKWTTLTVLAYLVAASLADIDWSAVAASLVPRLSTKRDWVTTVVAIFGVAVSPYLFFWQAAQEAEDQRVKPRREPLVDAPSQAREALRRIRADTLIGMAVAVLVGTAIMLTTAAAIHGAPEGIRTSVDAARALEPVAGRFAFLIFATGILGTGLLAVPVLAGSAAYAIGEALRWRVGLGREPREARAFYATLAGAAGLGATISFAGLDPLSALFWSAVVNGIVAAPLLALMVTVAGNAAVMGSFVVGRRLRLIGWLTVSLMGVSVAASGLGALALM